MSQYSQKRFRGLFSVAIFILVPGCALAEGTPAFSGTYAVTSKLIPEFSHLLRADLPESTEQLRKVSEQIAVLSSGTDIHSVQRIFQDVGKACSATRQKIEMFTNPIGDVIGGAFSMVPVAGAGSGLARLLAQYSLFRIVDAIVETITHEKQRNDLVNTFIDRLAAYRKESDSIEVLEGKLNASLNLMKLIHDTGGRNVFYQQLYQLEIGLKAQLRLLKKIIQTGHRFELHQSERVFDQNLLELEGVAAMFQKSREDVRAMVEALRKTTDENICVQLREGVDFLVEAELSRQILRKRLIDRDGQEGMELWFEAFQNQYIGNLGNFASMDDMNAMIKEFELVDQLFEARIQADPEVKEAIEEAHKSCVEAALRARALSLEQAQNNCAFEVRNLNSVFARVYSKKVAMKIKEFNQSRVNDIQVIRSRYNRKKITLVSDPSGQLYSRALDTYHRFFDALREEQSVDAVRRRNDELERMKNDILHACETIK